MRNSLAFTPHTSTRKAEFNSRSATAEEAGASTDPTTRPTSRSTGKLEAMEQNSVSARQLGPNSNTLEPHETQNATKIDNHGGEQRRETQHDKWRTGTRNYDHHCRWHN